MCERKDIKRRCYAGVSDKQILVVDHLTPADFGMLSLRSHHVRGGLPKCLVVIVKVK